MILLLLNMKIIISIVISIAMSILTMSIIIIINTDLDVDSMFCVFFGCRRNDATLVAAQGRPPGLEIEIHTLGHGSV